MTATRRGAPCDGGDHRLPELPWRLIRPDGEQLGFCGTPCILAWVCESAQREHGASGGPRRIPRIVAFRRPRRSSEPRHVP